MQLRFKSKSAESTLRKKACRNKYRKIPEQLREEIFDRLCIKKEGLRAVAAQLKVNHSTCRAIVKVYESEGRVGKKKIRNNNVNVISTFQFCMVSRNTPIQLSEVKVIDRKFTCSRAEDINGLLTESSKQEGFRLAQELLLEPRLQQLVLQQQLTSHIQQSRASYILACTPVQLNPFQQAFQVVMYPQFFAYNTSHY